MARHWTVLTLVAFSSGCGEATSSKATPATGAAGGDAAGGAMTQPAGGATGGGGAATQPGVGPIDTAALPMELALVCEGRAETLSFKLPCLVGLNLSGAMNSAGFHETECQLTGRPDQIAVNFVLPLVELPQLLNQPVELPFRTVAAPPGGGVVIDAERFHGSLSGIATFTQVDLEGRGFVASLAQGHVAWFGDQRTTFECSTIDGQFWGAPGSFL